MKKKGNLLLFQRNDCFSPLKISCNLKCSICNWFEMNDSRFMMIFFENVKSILKRKQCAIILVHFEFGHLLSLKQ